MKITKSENQITLGEFIRLLEAQEQDFFISYEFGSLNPTTFDSYRGFYDDLALGFSLEGSPNGPTVKELLKLAKECVGKTFHGYKGGEFTMTEDTPLWAANWGRSGQTAITGLSNITYWVNIQTEFVED